MFMRKRHPATFKAQAVQEILKEEKSIVQARAINGYFHENGR
jgi:transposase-like protein